MDYKLVIILLVLFIAIIVIYREITNLKEEMVVHLDNMTIDSKSYSTNLTNDINGIMTKYVDKIKNISVENIDQIKKINIINNQPILSKKYHDTDDSEIRTETIHMSDSKKDQAEYNIFHSKNNKKQVENSHYYMSDESCNHTDQSCDFKGNIKQEKKEENNVNLEEVDDVIFPKYNSEKNKTQIDNDSHTSIYENTTVNEKNNEEDKNVEEDIVLQINESCENNKDITDYNIKNLKKSFSEHIENNDDFIENVDKLDIDNESSIFIEDEDSYISFINSQTSKTEEKNDDNEKKEDELEKDENNNDNLDKKVEDNIVDTESSNEINIDINNILDKTKIFNEISTNNTVVMDKITTNNKKNITVFTNIDSVSTTDSHELENEIQSYMSSAYTGTITINKKDDKVPVFKKSTVQDTDDSIYKNLTIENLEAMSNYKLETLKKITKHLSLPLSIVKHNKRRNYKKDELYKNIKKFLKTKNQNPTSK